MAASRGRPFRLSARTPWGSAPLGARLLGLLLLVLFGAARAHYVTEHALGGAVLCVDPSSVQVGVRGDGTVPDAVLEASIARRLTRFLAEALPRYEVAHERRDSCAGSSDFVLVHLLVFHAGSEGLGDGYSYTYTVSAQVGAHAPEAALAVETPLEEPRYAAISSFIYSEEATGESFQSFLPGLAEALVRDLVAAWWLDNAPARAAPPLPLLGGLLALGAALAAWWGFKRRARA